MKRYLQRLMTQSRKLVSHPNDILETIMIGNGCIVFTCTLDFDEIKEIFERIQSKEEPVTSDFQDAQQAFYTVMYTIFIECFEDDRFTIENNIEVYDGEE